MNDKPENEPQISVELNGTTIQISVSAFNDILEREVTKFVLENNAEKKDIIGLKKLKKNVEYWKSKYEKLEAEAKALESVVKRLERDFKNDEFAQTHRSEMNSVSQNVKIIPSNRLNMANAHKYSDKEDEVLTILDNGDEIVMTSDLSKTKQHTINENVIDLIDSDNDTQNGNDKVLPIITELVKSLTTKVRMPALSLHGQKPDAKSKTMSVNDTDPSDADNTEIVNKKIHLLNDCEVINDNEPDSTNL